MEETERPRKTRPRSKTRQKDAEDESLIDGRQKRPERFDLLLQEAVAETNHSSGNRSGKKKRTKQERNLLDKIKSGHGLVKERDETLLANTFDPDDVKSAKSNKRREQEQLEQMQGKDNLAFEDATEVRSGGKGKGKGKKSVKKAGLERNENDETIVISELAAPTKNSEKAARRSVAGRARRNDAATGSPSAATSPTMSPTPDESDSQLEAPAKRRTRRTKKKRTPEDTDKDRGLSDETFNRSADDLEQSEDVLSPDVDDEGKPKVKKKRRRKKKVQDPEADGAEAEGDAEEAPPPKVIEDDGRVIAVTVHRTDKLKTDFNTAHPLVRISFIDADTGAYLKKQNKTRIVASIYENQNENVDYILPIMTQPFDFKQHKSTLPVWEEIVVFFENFNYIVQEEPRVLMFFELLDFVSMRSASRKYNMVKQQGGWHRIAWAFLKVVGATGVPNVDKKVRLQLYQPPVRFRAKPEQQEIFQWWQSAPRLPYASTLYVTVKSILPPSSVQPSSRSFFATQEERGKMSFDEMQRTLDFGATGRQASKKSPNEWSRLPGQMCRVPNAAYLKLPGGRLGCSVIKFSQDGKCIACGCRDADGYPVLVYEYPSGAAKGRLSGHYGIIYDLSWSRDDQSILSASSDGTARLWNSETMSSNPDKLLPHPSFVYCAQFHNRVQKVVVTGSYDAIVRVWNLQTDDNNAQLMQELDGHTSFVNSVCFDDEGTKLFSADGVGKIRVWNVYVTDQPSKRGILRDWSFNRELVDPEFAGSAINHIKLHPNGRRLLIHTRDNTLRMLDLRVYAVMQRYHGALNFREHLRSTVTPCGSFVIAGSEDAAAYMWNTETGDRVAMYSDLGYKAPVSDVDFHPHDHAVAFCAFSEHHPVLIYKYDFRAAQRDVGREVDLTHVKHLHGRPGSPEVRPGTALTTDKSDDDTLDDRRSKVASVTGSFRVNEVSRMDRIQRKLQAVTALTPGQHLPGHAVPTGGVSGTWGSTFDSTLLYQDLLSQAGTPAPGFMSPHATRTLTQSMLQQQFITQADVMRQVDPGGPWKPVFSSLGRGGGARSATPGRTPQLNMSMAQGRPQFTVQATTTGGLQTEQDDRGFTPPHVPVSARNVSGSPHGSVDWQVVALYDYQAQRSDELSFLRGDVITVLYKDNDNWWMGELSDGNQGFFPATYVATETPKASQDWEAEGFKDETVPGFSVDPATDDDDDSNSKTTAVVTKSGNLQFLSAPDSELPSSQKNGKKKSRLKVDDMAIENEMKPLKPTGKKNKKSRKVQESEA